MSFGLVCVTCLFFAQTDQTTRGSGSFFGGNDVVNEASFKGGGDFHNAVTSLTKKTIRHTNLIKTKDVGKHCHQIHAL